MSAATASNNGCLPPRQLRRPPLLGRPVYPRSRSRPRSLTTTPAPETTPEEAGSKSTPSATDAAITALANGCHNLTTIDLFYCSNVTDAAITALANGCHIEVKVNPIRVFVGCGSDADQLDSHGFMDS